MKKYLKQNLLLSISMIIASIICCILIFQIIRINSSRAESNKNLSLLKEKIKKLNRYTPYPSKENIKKVNRDIKELSEKIIKTKEIYGDFYSESLRAFIYELYKSKINNLLIEEKALKEPKMKDKLNLDINKLKQLTKIEELVNFKKFWTEYIEKQKNANYKIPSNQLLDKFRANQNYQKSSFNRAKKEFTKIFQNITIENIIPENIDEYILNALDMQLNFTGVRCKIFILGIEKTLNNMLKQANVNIPSGKIKLFNDEFKTVPSNDQIPYIVQYTRFFEDFFTRLINSKVDSIISYRKLNGLKGSIIDNFTILKYELVIIIQQKSLLNFLNSLQEAYKDNKIYKLKSLTLIKLDNRAVKIPAFDKNYNRNNQVKILLGTSDLIKSTIQIEYIIYNNKKII